VTLKMGLAVADADETGDPRQRGPDVRRKQGQASQASRRDHRQHDAIFGHRLAVFPLNRTELQHAYHLLGDLNRACRTRRMS
jgi:hypothetical protein